MKEEPIHAKIVNTQKNKALFDPQDYIHHLDGIELTDAEAEALLATLWEIMVQFVDLGFQFEASAENDPVEPQNIKRKETDYDRTK